MAPRSTFAGLAAFDAWRLWDRALDFLPSMVLITLAAGIVLVAIWRWSRAARGAFCPGPRPSWVMRLAWRWLVPRVCGYDLAGLPRGPLGVTCPECGTLIAPRRIRSRLIFGVRFGRLGVILAIMGVALARTDLGRGRWIELLPDTALVMTKRLAGEALPRRMQREWEGRLADGLAQTLAAEGGWRLEWHIAGLIDELRDDRVRFNAMGAVWDLASLGSPAVPGLTAALESDDRQQRLGAAYALRQMRARPSPALVRVTIEALEEDPSEFASANEAAAYLLMHARAIQPALSEAMRSGDEQQRLFAASIAAMGGCGALQKEFVPVLVDCTRDNDQWHDAKLAIASLIKAGPTVLESIDSLERAGGTLDKQQQMAIEVVRLCLVQGVPDRLDGSTSAKRARLEAIRVRWKQFCPSMMHWPWEINGVWLGW